MITITGAATPVNPTTASASGGVTSSGTISSFAEQLASAIVQMGADVQPGSPVQIDITAAPSQDSDTRQFNVAIHSAPGAGASPSTPSPDAAAPKQYSFFQYIIDGASAPLASSGAKQASGTLAASQSDPGWLSPPYYQAPPVVMATWENPKGVINQTAAPESDLQLLAAQHINDPQQFVWGGIEATTPQEFVSSFVSYAQLRAAMYPDTCPAGYDPVAMGTKYANLVLDTIKHIQFNSNGSSPHASIYDAWVAGVNTWLGNAGTANA